jgi:GAF domain-containing protein
MDQSSSRQVAARGASVEPDVAKLDPEGVNAAEAFARLASELYESPSVADAVKAVVDFALQAECCSHAGLVLAVRGPKAEVAAATDCTVEAICGAQLSSGAGPLFEALSGRTVQVTATATDSDSAGWQNMATESGIGTELHVPLIAGGHVIGVLSLFDAATRSFSADDEAIAHILAQHASVAVANAQNDESLAQAIDARRLVGQAMGILMERFDIDADRAFAILRRYSQDTNTKLREVAQHLIDTRRLPQKPLT